MKLPWLHHSSPVVAADPDAKIAEPDGESPSNVPAVLDKDAGGKSWMRLPKGMLPKAMLANLNPLGSIEFAIRYSVQKLGAKRVAEILGVGEWTLYKGVNPNEPGRKLPDLSWQRILDLVGTLKREGHTEFFSTVVQAAGGDGLSALEHLPSVHHALSAVSVAHGDVARLLVLATDPDTDGGAITSAKAAVIAEAVEKNQAALKRLLSQVLAEGAAP